MSKVSVVIPNYNGSKFIKKCLDALKKQEYKDFDVILVDNGSTDDSVTIANHNGDGLSLQTVLLSENYGFPRAVNEGIRASRAPYVILLNNDAYAGKNFVGQLLEAIEEEGDVFSAQALMLQYNNKELADDAGDAFSAMGWGFARGKDKPAKRYNKQCDIFSSCAGAAIYRRDVFDEIGYFDEDFFAYLEDVDIGYRARLYGYRNIFVPTARVLHVGSGASGSRYNEFKIKLSARNAIWVCFKNMAGWQISFNAPFLLAGIAIKAIFFKRKGFLREYMAGVGEGFMGLFRLNEINLPRKHYDNYVKLQKELLKNIFKRLGA